MSKSGELRILRYGYSVDAPINYRHRTGDSEGDGGSMLDLYVQEKGVEEVLFEADDETAKAVFLKGFSGYLRKVFSKTEREFLKRLMSGNEKLQDVGRAMGVDWFKYMQAIQRKAYKKTLPLLKLCELSGWSRAEEFTTQVLRRLSLMEDGAMLEDFLPQKAHRARVREALKQAKADNAALTVREKKAYNALWREKHREQVKAYSEKHREKKKSYYEAHREEIKATRRAYRKANREKIKAYNKAYREAHREEIKANKKIYREVNLEERKKYHRVYNAAHREEINAQNKVYRETHREELREYREARREEMKAYQKAYRARKKAEKLAAIEAARAVQGASAEGNV
ncbi:MAG: hypothetical protein IJX91_02500 [Clostridia bacterium]|nr:hypothetical protein [Clostridia bacterium]